MPRFSNIRLTTHLVILGLAFGFLYLPSLVIVGLWFDKKRGIAVGITVSASGIGILALPPICNYFIENYGWRDSLYFQLALVMLAIPLTFLYRDVPSQYTNSQFQKKKAKESREEKFFDSLSHKRKDGSDVRKGPCTKHPYKSCAVNDTYDVRFKTSEQKNAKNPVLGTIAVHFEYFGKLQKM